VAQAQSDQITPCSIECIIKTGLMGVGGVDVFVRMRHRGSDEGSVLDSYVTELY
jgi:hypothetical protein